MVAFAWCVALYGARRYQTGSPYFFYLVYNLALALIPLLLSTVAVRLNGAGLWRFGVWGAWLLFFPNAPYLVTDLIHLRPRPEVPFWFDWLMLVSFSGTGILIGYVSLAQVHRSLARRLSPGMVVGLLWGILGLTAFGIYLGRFPRWNSWDLLTRPTEMLHYLADLLFAPWEHPAMVVYCFGVTGLLGAGYFASGWLAGLACPVGGDARDATE